MGNINTSDNMTRLALEVYTKMLRECWGGFADVYMDEVRGGVTGSEKLYSVEIEKPGKWSHIQNKVYFEGQNHS